MNQSSIISIIIKPIGFIEIKEEMIIKIEGTLLISDLIKKIDELYFTGSNLSFLLRGKKLQLTQSIQSQGVKDKSKLMMQRYKESDSEDAMNKAQTLEMKIETAKKHLVSQGHEEARVLSLIKTLPNYTYLSSEEMVSKVLFFINTVKKEEVTEYSLEIPLNSKTFDLDENNLSSLFAVGNGSHGQLGVGGYLNINNPLKVRKLHKEKIKVVACGMHHTLALTENHTVFTWGRYFKPMTSNKQESIIGDNPLPICLESLSNEMIIKIACGSSHSMAINDKGELFTWGEGIYGQLGHSNNNNEYYPRKVDLPNVRFIDMSGGSTHSIALSDNNYLFGWGSNEKNQLSLYNKITNTNTPHLLPIYESNYNYLIDEYNYLNNINQFYSDIDRTSSISITSSLPLFNELSTNIDDLMKIKLIACGTWYTVVTSQLFPSLIYIMGNNYKNILSLTFFHNNKLHIKQIVPSNCSLYVLTNDNRLFKIEIDNLVQLSSGNEAIQQHIFDSNINIDKIGVGYNYIIFLTQSKECYYHALNSKVGDDGLSILNKDIKSNIYDICSGPDFYFLLTRMNSSHVSQLLFEQINVYLNNRQMALDHSYHFDTFFISEHNSLNSYSLFPIHSVIIQQFISLKNIKVKGDNHYIIPLTNAQILLFIKVVYTYSIDIFELSLEKKNQMLNDICEIQKFIIDNRKDELSDILLQLIDSYKEKVQEFIDIYSKISPQTISAVYSNHLMKVYRRIIWKEINSNNSIEDTKAKDKEIIQEDREEIEEEEDDREIDEGRDRNPNKKQKKPLLSQLTGGVVVSSSSTNTDLSESRSLNINLYKGYEKQIEYNYQFINRIKSFKEKISTQVIINLNNSIPQSLLFTIQSNDFTYYINKEIVGLKSLLFNNIINIEHMTLFDINKTLLDIAPEVLKAFISFLTYDYKNSLISYSHIIDLLCVADYFMADNLLALLESALEDILNISNSLCLLEISKDYLLTSLHRSVVTFLMFNINEVKNKGMIKQLKLTDKKQLEMVLNLNNKSL